MSGCFFSSVIIYWWGRSWWRGLLHYRSPLKHHSRAMQRSGLPHLSQLRPVVHLCTCTWNLMKPSRCPPWDFCVCKCLHMQRQVSVLFYSIIHMLLYVSVCGLTCHTLYTCSRLKSGKPICRANQYAYLYAKSSSCTCRFINLSLTQINLCEYTSPWSHFLHNLIKQAMIKISMIENGVHLKTHVYDKWYLTWFYFVFIRHRHFIGTLPGKQVH